MYLVFVCLKQDPRKRNSVDDQSQDELTDFRPCAEQQIWRGVILCTLPYSLPNLFKKQRTGEDNSIGRFVGSFSFRIRMKKQ